MSAIVLNIRQNSKYNIYVSVLFGENVFSQKHEPRIGIHKEGELLWSI